ncbi:PilW family protein [Francisella philomiragia]|uniref:PilW family protein n=1 Tax=Francisella philomiragia TaxID=28110 RepID=UPI001903B7C4|nr:type II secretion system protein [Francisella philomiragia]MBK2025597.1 prepilin-type cleavage/methylation domain-containing protein [Francisella philomiragia]
MAQTYRNRITWGFTLVELMVGITISIIVITMAVNIYISTKKSYNKAKLNTEQNIKIISAQKVLSDAIINAGLSCKYGDSHQTYVNRTGENPQEFKFLYDTSSVRVGKISSIEGFLQQSLYTKQKFLYQPNTNYLMIKTDSSFSELTQKPLNLSLYLQDFQQWQKGDYLALCNNDYIDIVKVLKTDNTTKTIKLVSAPTNEFNKGDYVGKINIQIFYTAAVANLKNPGKYTYSLYMFVKSGDNNAVTYPLVEGVSNLKLAYAILDKDKLSWKEILQDTNIDQIDAKALKISFQSNNQYYDKVVLI